MDAKALRVLLVVVALALTGCGASAESAGSGMTLYTCATANVEQALVSAFEQAHPGTRRTCKVARRAPDSARAWIASIGQPQVL